MERFKIVISYEAKQDIKQLSDVIMFEYKSPITVTKYLKGLYTSITKLKVSPTSFMIQTRKSLQQYDPNPRRINYKRMAIIFNVIDNTVYIRRVIPSVNIAGL